MRRAHLTPPVHPLTGADNLHIHFHIHIALIALRSSWAMEAIRSVLSRIIPPIFRV
jgi:hypothetical protein